MFQARATHEAPLHVTDLLFYRALASVKKRGLLGKNITIRMESIPLWCQCFDSIRFTDHPPDRAARCRHLPPLLTEHHQWAIKNRETSSAVEPCENIRIGSGS